MTANLVPVEAAPTASHRCLNMGRVCFHFLPPFSECFHSFHFYAQIVFYLELLAHEACAFVGIILERCPKIQLTIVPSIPIVRSLQMHAILFILVKRKGRPLRSASTRRLSGDTREGSTKEAYIQANCLRKRCAHHTPIPRT